MNADQARKLIGKQVQWTWDGRAMSGIVQDVYGHDIKILGCWHRRSSLRDLREARETTVTVTQTAAIAGES